MDVKQIEVKIARATTLPVFPQVATQILALTENQNVSAREYERIISQDAALASKILRTANSPYFGGHGNITTLPRALSVLGVNTIRSICLTVAFQSALSLKGLDKRFIVNNFWQHSLAVACAAKILACLKRDPLAEEAFIAGLLHDIGKLALCMFLPLEANLVFTTMEKSAISQYEAEMQCLEITHEEIGALAAERWGLPEMYRLPISKHHTPTEDVYEIDPLTAYVHIANVLAYEADMGFAPAGEMNCADPLIVAFLDIPDGQYEPIRQTITNEVARLSGQMGI